MQHVRTGVFVSRLHASVVFAMPRSPKYPLKPLQDARARQVDDAAAKLADKTRAVEVAVGKRDDAERTRVEAEERAARVRAAEQALLSRGALRSVDLARASAWESSVAREANALGAAVNTAVAEIEVRRREEADARAELLKARTDQKVVETHAAQFEARERRQLDAKEEREIEDARRSPSTNEGS